MFPASDIIPGMRRRDFANAFAFDLAGPNNWPKKYSLIPTMAGDPASIKDGMIRPELHGAHEKSLGTAIEGAPGRDPLKSLEQAIGDMDV